MKIPGPFKSAFDSITNFFSNVIVGSLVIWILNNITTIMNTIKDIYIKIKDIVTTVGKFLQPVWNIFKWIVEGFSPSGLELVNAILSDQNTRDLMDASKIAEVDDLYNKKLTDRIKEIEAQYKAMDANNSRKAAYENAAFNRSILGIQYNVANIPEKEQSGYALNKLIANADQAKTFLRETKPFSAI